MRLAWKIKSFQRNDEKPDAFSILFLFSLIKLDAARI